MKSISRKIFRENGLTEKIINVINVRKYFFTLFLTKKRFALHSFFASEKKKSTFCTFQTENLVYMETHFAILKHFQTQCVPSLIRVESIVWAESFHIMQEHLQYFLA